MPLPPPAGPKLGTFAYRTASKVNIIRDRLAGYVSGSKELPGAAVISELLQNADDARASTIRFIFYDDYLEVRNNSYFCKKDFANIKELMAAGKAQDRETIGAFGTGFIATYHFTDQPELLSKGQHLVFNPLQDDPPYYSTSVGNETIFRFPWRMEKTQLARRIGGHIWKPQEIEEIKQGIAPLLYCYSLFLRNVRYLEVYEGSGHLLAQVHHDPPKSKWSVGSITAEHRSIAYTTADGASTHDEWLFYSQKIDCRDLEEDVVVKADTVTIAFPFTTRPWLEQHLPARIYNFLPTAIRTGLAFQINGAFFPDSNRRGILLNAEMSEKAAWNRRVIAAAGQIFSSVAEDVRDRLGVAQRLYDLFPLSPQDEIAPLQDVRDAFLTALPGLEVIQSSRGAWMRPAQIILPNLNNSNLTRLAEEYLDLLPRGTPVSLRKVLQDLGCSTLELDHVLELLTPSLDSGKRLERHSPHPMIDSRAKLERLYRAIAEAEGQAPKNDQPSITERFVDLALLLAENGRLYTSSLDDALWCGGAQVRGLNLHEVVRFVSVELQERHPILREILCDLTGAMLLQHYIAPALPAKTNIENTSADLPPLLRGREALAATLRFLAADKDQLEKGSLEHLPIILDGRGRLYPAISAIRSATDDDRDVLVHLDIPLVDATFQEDPQLWLLYQQAGVKRVSFDDVLESLERCVKDPAMVDEPGRALTSISDLHELIEYLHRQLAKAPPVKMADAVQRLESLAIFPTSGGRLIPAAGAEPPMIATNGDPRTLAVLRDVLRRDVLIDPAFLRGNIPDFLTERLGMQQLTPIALLQSYILEHYHDPTLTDVDRQGLLGFVRELLQDPGQKDGVEVALQAARHRTLAMVRYSDGRQYEGYRAPAPIYFETDLVYAVLGEGFLRPHPQYDRSWKLLLRRIGVRADPPIEATAERLLSLTAMDAEPPNVLYGALQRGWATLPKLNQKRLQEMSVFWDGTGYWAAEQVLDDSQSQFFGERRAYRSNLSEDARRLLDLVRPQPPDLQWRDHLDAISEIAEDYAADDVVSADDQKLLIANLAQINLALSAGAASDNNSGLVSELRHRRLVLIEGGKLRAIEGGARHLMIAAGSGAAAGIPALLRGQVELTDCDYARAGQHLLTQVLGVQEIHPFQVTRDAFAKVYTDQQDHDARRELLEFLQQIWDTLSRQQIAELRSRLAPVLLIRTDDDRYYPPSQITFDSIEVVAIFDSGGHRPHTPHCSYGIVRRGKDVQAWEQSPWVQLLQDLGVHIRPSAADLLAAIRATRTACARPSPADRQALVPVYDWLRQHIAELDTEDDRALLRQLAAMDWIPVRQGEVWGWYRPADSFRKSHSGLIGAQAPILEFEDPNEGLREQLGFPRQPPPTIVAQHLLAISQQRLAQEPPSLRRIYEFLGEHWERLQADQQATLCNGSVIWADGRWWAPAQAILFSDDAERAALRRLFGGRRGLFSANGGASPSRHRTAFIHALAITYDPVQSHLALIREIAAAYAEGEAISSEDHALLIATFNHLGRVTQDPQIAADLRELVIFPGHDLRLYRSTNILLTDPGQPDLRRRFCGTDLVTVHDETSLPSAKDDTKDASPPMLRLTEHGFRLIRDIGVRLFVLGEGLERRLVKATDAVADDAHTTQLQRLLGPFRRIRRTLQDRGQKLAANAAAVEAIGQIRCFTCSEMSVQYTARLPSGKQIPAKPTSRDRALCTRDEQKHLVLYARDWSRAETLAEIAVDLALVFFPGSDVSPVVEGLLRCETSDEASRYLSRHRYLSELGEEPGFADEEVEESSDVADEQADDSEADVKDAQMGVVSTEPGLKDANAGQAASSQHQPMSLAGGTAPANPPMPQVRPKASSSAPTAPAQHIPAPTAGAPSHPAPALAPTPGTPSRPAPAPAPSSRPASATPRPPERHYKPASRAVRQRQDVGATTRVEWQPMVQPEQASLRVTPFQPSTRPIRVNGQGVTSTGRTSEPRRPEESAEPPAPQMSQAERQRIGQWGEAYVLRHLKQQLRERYPNGTFEDTPQALMIRHPEGIVAYLRWLNGSGSEASGHDILLREGDIETYIEVKATTEATKEWIQISGAQWEFARLHGSHFHLYRVFQAGTTHASIQVIEDPVARWQRGELRVDPLRVLA